MLPNNPLRWLTLLVGLGSIYAGVDYIVGAEGDELGQALLILLPFGIAMVVIATTKPSRRGSAEGVAAEAGATIVRATAGRSRAVTAGLAGFMCVGLGMALFPGEGPNTDETVVRVFGSAVAAAFAALLALNLRAPAGQIVRLTPAGIEQGRRFVAWDEIAGVGTHAWRGAVSIVLRIEGRQDVQVPLQLLAVDPSALHRLVVHMHANPADRAQLADPGGTEVLARFGLGASHAGGGEQPEEQHARQQDR